MKTIYLLRHAKSSWKNKELEDFDRPLAKRGRQAATEMGKYLADHSVQPAQILCSPSMRTRETLERMEKRFDAAVPVRYEKAVYLADAPALLRRLRRVSDSLPSIMVIGHNPGLERLTLILATKDGTDERQLLGDKFPTGALAVLNTDIERWHDLQAGCARLDAFVRPKDLISM